MSRYDWLTYILPGHDNIDPASVRIVEANKILYSRDNTSKLLMSDIHIKLKFGTDTEKNDLWKAIIYEVDKDFPWNPLNRPNTVRKFCPTCQGWLWPNVILDPIDLKKAAKQVGMTRKGPEDVRVQSFIAAYKCGGQVVDKVIEE